MLAEDERPKMRGGAARAAAKVREEDKEGESRDNHGYIMGQSWDNHGLR
jgi:hypothetical protein